MTRVKGGVHTLKTRRNILRMVKGYRNRRSTHEAAAYEAISKAGAYAFAHRKDKKNDFKRLWQVQVNAFIRAEGAFTWSKFMPALKKKNVGLNRKMLAELAEFHPETLKKVIAHVK